MKIGEKIKARRLELGLTLEEVADRMHIKSKSTVQRWETGYIEKVSYPNMKLLAETLDVPLSYFDDENDKHEAPTVNLEAAEIGRRIRRARVKKGLVQTTVAEAVGTTKQTIYKYEQGIISSIPVSRIKALAKLLDVTPAYLVGWEDEDPILKRPLKVKIHRVRKTHRI